MECRSMTSIAIADRHAPNKLQLLCNGDPGQTTALCLPLFLLITSALVVNCIFRLERPLMFSDSQEPAGRAHTHAPPPCVLSSQGLCCTTAGTTGTGQV